MSVEMPEPLESPGTRFDTEIIRQPLRLLEIIGCVIVIGVFGFYLRAALSLPMPFNNMDIGAGGFPKLIAITTLIAAVLVALTAIVKSLLRLPYTLVALKRPVMVLLAAVALVAQALLFTRIGALATTGLFALLTMLICGERRPLHLIASPVLLVGFIYLVFVLAFGVRLP